MMKIKCQIFLPSPNGLFSNSIQLTIFLLKKTRVLHFRNERLAIVQLEKEERLINRRSDAERFKSFSVFVDTCYKILQCNESKNKKKR